MEFKTLVIDRMSATGLKDVRKLFKMNVFTSVSISDDPQSMKKTSEDKNGGSNPTWNDVLMKFNIESAAQRDLVFQFWCDRSLGNRAIGEVRVPVQELPDTIGDGNRNPTSQEIRRGVSTPSGELQGELNFSFRFDETPYRPSQDTQRRPLARAFGRQAIKGVKAVAKEVSAGLVMLGVSSAVALSNNNDDEDEREST